ncbi:glycogen debranching protein GlgX [Cyanobium sp. WAJ14-Wanaka]|uniref:glycogen debranching protein GlgX n=1 Tax=Cyanobium sp. WAJ14-Wanaka TaxID=2823725 RepID=UPI0020CDA0FE|nr:glycogen debranching protein GlgX [Cyanobium sp. WAJ14-Wanaka]MCP9775038.1 glycogen debranching protein GlgX [Cyanobium sp. WAJ14-Wanaka]
MAFAPLAPGSSSPLGATPLSGGVNFSIYSKDATAVELCLFDSPDAVEPSQVYRLEGEQYRTFHYWHCFVAGLSPGQVYGYRVEGPYELDRGLLFDVNNLLLDPYGLALVMPANYRRTASQLVDRSMKSVVVDPAAYDWEGDKPLRRPSRDSVIYELHVKGFTADPSSGVEAPNAGTYLGLIEKIPYLQDLGVTAVELLPVFQFDPFDAPGGLTNYWGYQPISFFVPHHGYSSGSGPMAPLDEFRTLVKALHRAGIEVILDVVFNHTAEADADGPTFCYRGLANSDYYLLKDGGAGYADYTGCFNTLNANNPIVRRLIRHSLRYWVEHMHVDGFRFDLASVLSRDETGAPSALPPILWDIDTDPVLAGTKLIAEAWDAAGLYQVGTFVADNWQEWNGRFRDDVRRFLRGDSGFVRSVAQRLIGSPDIYGYENRDAESSVNFVTCHDGFTLSDLVSYNTKHNESNLESNRDGSNDNFSWNCGAEGYTDEPSVLRLRLQQRRNFLTLLLLSNGTPMIGMGDEIGRSQSGNNNAYCQDGVISWMDWVNVGTSSDLGRFVSLLIDFRQHRDFVSEHQYYTLNSLIQLNQLRWHGVKLDQPDWSDESHSFAVTIISICRRFCWHLMVNAYWQTLNFEVPVPPLAGDATVGWREWIDTAKASPDDISIFGKGSRFIDSDCQVSARSIRVLSCYQA